MSIFVVICFALAAVLGFLSAGYIPAGQPRFNLLGAAVGFLALGFFLQALSGAQG
jgi:hypothetical protein